MPKCLMCGEDAIELTQRIRELEQLLDEAAATAKLSETPEYSDEEEFYVASKYRNTFHRPGCKWASYIEKTANYIEFSNHAEAVEANYKPCKTCCA